MCNGQRLLLKIPSLWLVVSYKLKHLFLKYSGCSFNSNITQTDVRGPTRKLPMLSHPLYDPALSLSEARPSDLKNTILCYRNHWLAAIQTCAIFLITVSRRLEIDFFLEYFLIVLLLATPLVSLLKHFKLQCFVSQLKIEKFKNCMSGFQCIQCKAECPHAAET